MHGLATISLVVLSLLGSEQTIDDFAYGNSAAARGVWIAGEGSSPVDVVPDGDRSVVRLAAPFGAEPKRSRVVADRRVELDLTAPGQFTLDAAADVPQSVGHVTLYFRSGNGWYGASCGLAQKGWQTLRFAKSAFHGEGNPAGWAKIDGVRLAVWRSSDTDVRDTTIRFRRLAAVCQDIAIVVDDKTASRRQNDSKAIHDSVHTVTTLLEDLGLGADPVSSSDVAAGGLGQRRVAILPYNPRLSADCTKALIQFVDRGGKLWVGYWLDPQIGDAMGFGHTKYVPQDRAGRFAVMRFDAADIAQLPKSVRQASWNITTAEPVGHNARVIARWYDDAGQTTGQPAMLLSDRGVMMSHVLLPDDRNGKRQLLGAILCHLAPSLRKAIATAKLERANQVGHCTSMAELLDYLKSTSVGDAQEFERGQRDFKRANEQLAQGRYSEAAASADVVRDAMVQAYLRAAKSERADPKAAEGRAVWNHSGTGAYAGDWDRSAKLLADNGFNMVLPNMLWGGVAHYASDVLPRSDTFRKHGDQIEQCCKAAKKHGLEVHVWKVNYNLVTAPKTFIEELRREGRTQVSNEGKSCDWLCPSHPENQKLELDSLLEVARKYPVDGLHFDYIRYPDGSHCYCDGCRKRFEAESGRKVADADWPEECYSGARKKEYRDWRCRQITSLVAAVSREARKIRPGIKISAAVFGAYPDCRESVGQDWPEWVKAGYVDFLCPMDYTTSDEGFASLVRNQMRLVDGRTPLYPGIGATATDISMTPDRVVGQIHIARSLGAAGWTVFNFDAGTAASIVPGIGSGAGARRVAPPHRAP